MSLDVEYRRDLFEPNSILQLCWHYRDAFSLSASDIVGVNLQTVFDHIPINRDRALSIESEMWTYHDLREAALSVAGQISVQNSGVAIINTNPAHTIIMMLGVMLSGNYFVVIDPHDPRIKEILKASGALKVIGVGPCDMACDSVTFDRKGCACPYSVLAYTIFTSGSTGSPRAVPITHEQLSHSTRQRRDQYDTAALKRQLLVSPLTFDSSLAVVFGALTSGAEIVVVEPSRLLDSAVIWQAIEKNRCTQLLLTPGYYQVLLEDSLAVGTQSLQQVIVAGDVCSPGLVKRHFDVFPDVRLFNEYGPSECTIWASVYECQPSDVTRVRIPIGRPLPGIHWTLQDDELLLAGEQIFHGYLNGDDSCFTHIDGKRYYRTGDRVRCLMEGGFEFCGRIDQQIKVRGFRVSLQEVQEKVEALSSRPVCVFFVQGHIAVAFEERGVDLSPLAEVLPVHMIPTHTLFVHRLPLTRNGKIDRSALAERLQLPQITHSRLDSRLQKIVNRLLGSVDDTKSFFENGGNSIQLIQFLNELRSEFTSDLTIADLFEYSQLQDLDAFLTTGKKTPLKSRAVSLTNMNKLRHGNQSND